MMDNSKTNMYRNVSNTHIVQVPRWGPRSKKRKTNLLHFERVLRIRDVGQETVLHEVFTKRVQHLGQQNDFY